MLSKLAPLLLVAFASASCPNACSGHGRCTNYAPQFSTSPTQVIEITSATASTYGYDSNVVKKDSCTCFTHKGHNGATVYQWTGADCSLHTCPHAASFAGASEAAAARDGGAGTAYHTQEVECSGKGACDRKTGQCACFDGYEGDACHRSACPNSCSGAGKCLTLMQIAEDIFDANANFYGDYMTAAAKYDVSFDRTQMMGCVCDAGRAGPDCSLIDCPSTSDPMGGEGSESGRSCSGRGRCESSTGTCECYDGYFGTQCEQQRNRQL